MAALTWPASVAELGGVSPIMKSTLLVIFLAVFAATLRAEPTLYQPEGWALGTKFPAQPAVSEHKTSVPDGEIVELRASVVQDDELYFVERTLLPIQLAPERHDAIYAGGRDYMQQQNPRVLKSEEKITVCGHEGRRYVLESKDGQHVTEQRTVIIGNELFGFVYERPTSHPVSAAANTFFSAITSKKG